jgi:predicted dehydrogenase
VVGKNTSNQVGFLITARPVVAPVSNLRLFLREEESSPLSGCSNGSLSILINLIHEIDLIRYLCGEIRSVRAVSSKKIRHFEVEDSAACTLELLSGALANISLSDTTVSPWSWDTAAGEDRQLFDYRPVPTHFFAGTEGAISIPELTLWVYAGEKGRHKPIDEVRLPVPYENTYANQLRHFIDVVRGLAKPVIDGEDAARTLQATLAVIASAESGSAVDLRSA